MLFIADDSPVITKFFKKLFQDEYEVLVASNGIEAIDIVEQYKDKNSIELNLVISAVQKNETSEN